MQLEISNLEKKLGLDYFMHTRGSMHSLFCNFTAKFQYYSTGTAYRFYGSEYIYICINEIIVVKNRRPQACHTVKERAKRPIPLKKMWSLSVRSWLGPAINSLVVHEETELGKGRHLFQKKKWSRKVSAIGRPLTKLLVAMDSLRAQGTKLCQTRNCWPTDWDDVTTTCMSSHACTHSCRKHACQLLPCHNLFPNSSEWQNHTL